MYFNSYNITPSIIIHSFTPVSECQAKHCQAASLLLALSIDLCTLTPLRIPQLRLQLGQPPNSGRSHHSGPSPVRVAFGAMKKCISDKKTDVCLQVLGGHICTLQQGPQLGGWYVVITFNPGCASTSSSPLPFYDFNWFYATLYAFFSKPKGP